MELTESEKKIYDTLLSKAEKYAHTPANENADMRLKHEDNVRYDWIEERAHDLYIHHSIMDIWKPRIVRTLFYNLRKEVPPK